MWSRPAPFRVHPSLDRFPGLPVEGVLCQKVGWLPVGLWIRAPEDRFQALGAGRDHVVSSHWREGWLVARTGVLLVFRTLALHSQVGNFPATLLRKPWRKPQAANEK